MEPNLLNRPRDKRLPLLDKQLIKYGARDKVWLTQSVSHTKIVTWHSNMNSLLRCTKHIQHNPVNESGTYAHVSMFYINVVSRLSITSFPLAQGIPKREGLGTRLLLRVLRVLFQALA